MGLVAAAAIVVRALQRQWRRKTLAQKEAAKRSGDPAGNFSRWPRDREVKKISGKCSTRVTAQASHCEPLEFRNQDIDLALGDAEGSCGLGAGPPVDKDALDDQRPPRQRD